MFDFDSLYNEARGDAFTGGKRRFYDNLVGNINAANRDGKFTVTAVVKGKRDYETKIAFDEQGGLYDYACGCDNFSLSNGPCKHIIATALSYEEKAPKVLSDHTAVPKARTDAGSLSLIQEYSKRRHTRIMSDGGDKAELVPKLLLDDGGRLSLKFTIGTARHYTLKDVSDFVTAVSGKGFRRYGVELQFLHLIENFTPSSAPLVKFVVKAYGDRHDGAGEHAYKDELRLSGGDVDEFFNLYGGQSLELYESGYFKGLVLLDKTLNNLNLELGIEKVKEGYVSEFNLNHYRVIAGRNFDYVYTGVKFIRCDAELLDKVSPVMKTFNSRSRLFIAESDMPLFYNSVINEISPQINIKCEADLSVFEAPPFIAKLYLDHHASGIKGKLECSYDDEGIDIFKEEITDIVRDWESEGALKELLQKYFTLRGEEMFLEGEEGLYAFMQSGLSEVFNYAEVFMSASIQRMKIRRPPKIRVGVHLSGDLLNVELKAEEFEQGELLLILKAYNEKRKYIRLSDGSFVDLIDPSIGALSDILAVAEKDGDNLTVPSYYAPFLDSELREGFFNLERNNEFKELVKNLKNAETGEAAVPDTLKDVMRNYQKTGFRWLRALSDYGFGGILADDMGLGKSLQIIALLLNRKGTSIIVCPTTLILNWVNEIAKFAPSLRTQSVMGSFNERRELVGDLKNCDVVITSYELIRRDEELYKDIEFDCAIIDEAQYIKNPDTKNAKAVKTLKASHRFALTGTPVENSLSELWSIFDFIMPMYLKSYGSFRESFESEIVRGNEDAAERLKKLVKPFILRRLKSNVLKELPGKVETNIVASLSGKQKELYQANLGLIKNAVGGGDVNKIMVLAMLTKLRQICCEPALVYGDYDGNSAKLDTCLELTESAVEGGHKVLIFSQFTSMLDILKRNFKQKGISYYLLKGDTPKQERMRLVNCFNKDDTNVFLISLKAGGTGLNLTGADVVIHYDPWWNESVMNQATDRAYRLGQDKSVQVYKLILENTLEQKILSLQEKKTALSNLIVGENKVTAGDLVDLISTL